MTGRRLAGGGLAFGSYIVGLTTAAMSVALAVLIGPWDGFALGMIGGGGLMAALGGAGLARLGGPAHGRAVVLGLGLGAAWAVATALLVAALVGS